MDEHGGEIFVPAIVVAEIAQGIQKLHRSGGIARAERLAAWLENLINSFSDRILPIDAGVARRTGELSDQATAAGLHPGLADILIAATADLHDLVLLTCNTRHFETLRIEATNPLQELPRGHRRSRR